MLRGVAGESAVENEEHEDEEGEDAGENDEAEEGGEPGDRYAMSRSRTSGPPDEGGASVAHGRLIRLYARGVLNRWSFWRRWASSSSWCTALALLALGLPVVVVVGRGGSGSDDMLLFLVLAREDRRSKVDTDFRKVVRRRVGRVVGDVGDEASLLLPALSLLMLSVMGPSKKSRASATGTLLGAVWFRSRSRSSAWLSSSPESSL